MGFTIIVMSTLLWLGLSKAINLNSTNLWFVASMVVEEFEYWRLISSMLAVNFQNVFFVWHILIIFGCLWVLYVVVPSLVSYAHNLVKKIFHHLCAFVTAQTDLHPQSVHLRLSLPSHDIQYY